MALVSARSGSHDRVVDLSDRSEGTHAHRPVTYRAMRDTNRGGGLYSDAISQPMGSLVATWVGWSLHPTVVTIAGFLIGLATAIVAIAGVDHRPTWIIGLIVLVGWQLAYVCDCADGPIARFTGRTSRHGARVDVLVDFAVQTGVVASVVTAVQHGDGLPAWLLTAFASVWFVNLFVFTMSKTDGGLDHHLVKRSSPLISLMKMSRDYGFVVLVAGAAYAFWRPGLRVFVVAVLVVNGSFLVASIVDEAVRSMRAPPQDPVARRL
jgi:phosphatidylglycerophosphate synthase